MKLLSFIVALTCSVPLMAPTATAMTPYDLASDPSIEIDRAYEATPAGDVNGDGYQDLLLERGCQPGPVWVVFGPLQSSFAWGDDSVPGYLIEVRGETGFSCSLSKGPVGDMNGDGIDDIGIGSQGEDFNGRGNSGSVYVVYGSPASEDIDLIDWDNGTQGDRGFRIDGPYGFALIGADLAGAGDVNGDGLADLVTGSAFFGFTYVVFGRLAQEASIDLMSFDTEEQGDAGFSIATQNNNTNTGYSVDGAGDVNGDGLDDLVIGAIGRINKSIGRAFVIFGKVDGSHVSVNLPLEGIGFRIKGLHEGDYTGLSVAGVEDVNGDGLDDVMVGTPRSGPCCRNLAHVIFGKQDSRRVLLQDLGWEGVKIRGQKGDAAAESIADAGDIDGDGLPDVIVGARSASQAGRRYAGTVYVVLGSALTGVVRLKHLGGDGRKIIGKAAEEVFGYLVGGGADLDADGTPDVVGCSLPAFGNACYVISGADLI